MRHDTEASPSNRHWIFGPSGDLLGFYGNDFIPPTGGTTSPSSYQRGNLRIPRQELRRVLLSRLAPGTVRWGMVSERLSLFSLYVVRWVCVRVMLCAADPPPPHGCSMPSKPCLSYFSALVWCFSASRASSPTAVAWSRPFLTAPKPRLLWCWALMELGRPRLHAHVFGSCHKMLSRYFQNYTSPLPWLKLPSTRNEAPPNKSTPARGPPPPPPCATNAPDHE